MNNFCKYKISQIIERQERKYVTKEKKSYKTKKLWEYYLSNYYM